MQNNHILSEKQETFINFLIGKSQHPEEEMPSINAISQELGLSAACLREQLELARNLGLIKIQPRKGIQILRYEFSPAVIKSLYYAVKLSRDYFEQYAQLRTHLERAFFLEAVALLEKEDLQAMYDLIEQAQQKLDSDPVQRPHIEHRKYHMLFFEPLGNTFLTGLLETYWDMYELVGLDVYTDLDYLKSVWNYHRRIVDLINNGKADEAYELSIDHMKLLYQR
jgi:DNA-binding FadR family transcriptional regulator